MKVWTKIKCLTGHHNLIWIRAIDYQWVLWKCEHCNKEKDNQLLADISMELFYVPYVPNRAEWLLLNNRKVLADQMEFLMKRVPKASRLHAN